MHTFTFEPWFTCWFSHARSPRWWVKSSMTASGDLAEGCLDKWFIGEQAHCCRVASTSVQLTTGCLSGQLVAPWGALSQARRSISYRGSDIPVSRPPGLLGEAWQGQPPTKLGGETSSCNILGAQTFGRLPGVVNWASLAVSPSHHPPASRHRPGLCHSRPLSVTSMKTYIDTYMR